MERAFLSRTPTASELQLLSKFLGSYRDGSGNNRETDGTTRADSRQIERCFAELLHGKTTENKHYYDFVVESNESGAIAIRGASIKSKEIKNLIDFKDGAKKKSLRSHLEVSNSSAGDWKLCKEYKLSEDDFRNHQKADQFGEVILLRQSIERQNSEKAYIAKNNNATRLFHHRDCVFISVLYSPSEKGERSWLVSSFAIELPKPKKWVFRGACIVGTDEDDEPLYEWYALSGSQFKYYPKLATRLHGTDLFQLRVPAMEDLRAKSSRLFGD